MNKDVAQVFLEIPEAVAFNGITATQTVAAPAQTATAVLAPAISMEVSQVTLEIPGTASTLAIEVSQAWMEVPGDGGQRNLTVAQTVAVPTQSASMFDIIGSIDGGGTITDSLPHRSMSVTQTVGAPAQSAAVGDATLAPRLVTVTQTVAVPSVAAAADAQRRLSITQLVELPNPDARVRTRADVVEPVTGGYAPLRASKYRTRIGKRVLEANTFEDLRQMVLDAEAQARKVTDAVIVAAPAPAPAPPPPDPLADAKREMTDQVAAMQAQMQAALAQQQASAQQLAAQMDARAAQAEQQARMAMEIAARAKDDADALVALLN